MARPNLLFSLICAGIAGHPAFADEKPTAAKRLAVGDPITLSCPELRLRRVPGGPATTMPASGELEVRAQTDGFILVQSGAHRGWAPAACASSSIQAVPVAPAKPEHSLSGRSGMLLSLGPAAATWPRQVEAFLRLAGEYPSISFRVVRTGAPLSAVLAHLPTSYPRQAGATVWVDPSGAVTGTLELDPSQNELIAIGAAGDVVYRSSDPVAWDSAEVRRAVEATAASGPAFSLEMLEDLEAAPNQALGRPYLSPSCRQAAIEMASRRSQRAAEYATWQADLVDRGLLHDLMFWDTVVLIGLRNIAVGPGTRCFLESAAPFVAARSDSASTTFTTPMIPPQASRSAGLAALARESHKSRLRAVLLHVEGGALYAEELQAPPASPYAVREIHLQPDRGQYDAVAQLLGGTATGPTTWLVLY